MLSNILSSLLVITSILFVIAVIWRLNHGSRFGYHLSIIALGFAIIANLSSQSILASTVKWDWVSQQAVNHGIQAFLMISIAYCINAHIKRFIYQKRLTIEGEPTIPLLLQHLFSLLVYLLFAMIIMHYVYRQPFTALAATSGAIALIIGYSARSLLDEVFAGIALNIQAPLKIGDLVQINEEWGYVKNINWRSITYLDMDQNHVTLANTQLAASKIRNLDRPNKLTRRLFEFRVEYNAPPNEVIQQVKLAMVECPNIADHPWNYVAFLGNDETGMKYRVAFHIPHYDYWFIASDELVNSIWYRFARRGIRWAHQRHLNYKEAQHEEQGLYDTAYHTDNKKYLSECFKQVPIFDGFDTSDMELLFESAKLHVVGAPERIIHAGSRYHAMYLIATGEAQAYEVDDNGNETLIPQNERLELVGLMSFLTGTPQRTTIRARTECAVWEIPSESLHQVFNRKPYVMERLASNVTTWQAEEDETLNNLKMSRQQEARIINNRTTMLKQRILGFFNRSKKQASEDNSAIEFTNV